MLISFVNRSIVPYVIALSLCRLIARLCAKHAIALDWLDALIARACLPVFIQRFLYQRVSKFVETSIMRRSQWKPYSIRFRVETLSKIENREKDVKWNAWSELKIPARIRRYFFYLAGSAMWPTSTRLTDIGHYFWHRLYAHRMSSLLTPCTTPRWCPFNGARGRGQTRGTWFIRAFRDPLKGPFALPLRKCINPVSLVIIFLLYHSSIPLATMATTVGSRCKNLRKKSHTTWKKVFDLGVKNDVARKKTLWQATTKNERHSKRNFPLPYLCRPPYRATRCGAIANLKIVGGEKIPPLLSCSFFRFYPTDCFRLAFLSLRR